MKIILASQSPRRKELLQSLGYEFEIASIDCEEIFPENLEIKNIAGYLSKIKAEAYTGLEHSEILITADTIVALENEVLGKPANESEAKEMLMKLSGKIHQVYTGVTIRTFQSETSITDVADVEFDKLSNKEIDDYITNYKPFDKAGAYGIQEWIGMAKIKNIKGSFYTIMGLPTHLVYQEVERLKRI